MSRKKKLEKRRLEARIRRLKLDKKALNRVISRRDAAWRRAQENARKYGVGDFAILLIFMKDSAPGVRRKS